LVGGEIELNSINVELEEINFALIGLGQISVWVKSFQLHRPKNS